MGRVLSLARAGRRFGAASDGLTVASRDERVLIVVDGVERVRRAIAHATARLTVLHIAVVPAVAVHVRLGASPRLLLPLLPTLRLFGVNAVPPRPLPLALGAVIPRDPPELLQELVVDLEVVVRVRLGVVAEVAVGGVALGVVLVPGRGGVVAAGVGVVAQVAGGRRARGAALAARAERDGLVRRRARRPGGQGSGLHRRHPQRLVLLLLHGLLDLRAHVRNVHTRRDFR